MTYQPFIWVYAGATQEDLYAEQDDRKDLTLQLLSSPQCAFVAPAYSDELVENFAREMWDEIQGLYEESFEHDIPFNHLHSTTSATVCERPASFKGILPVAEVTIVQYYLMHSVEPLMQIVVQKRPVRSA